MAVSKPPLPPAGVRPPYWDDACKHLTRKDRVMKRLIAQSDGACLQTRFTTGMTPICSARTHPRWTC